MFLFCLLTDNVCDNALNLVSGQLTAEDNWPEDTYCQWLILAQDDDDYVILEFQNFHVYFRLKNYPSPPRPICPLRTNIVMLIRPKVLSWDFLSTKFLCS